MTGIDSSLGSVLASRIDTLIENVGAGARPSAAQTGASVQTGTTGAASTASGAALADAPPPPSAQATLSDVALTLDAISRFGGETTPPVLGQSPIWPAPPAIDAPAASGQGVFGSSGDAASSATAAPGNGAGGAVGAGQAAGAAGSAAASDAGRSGAGAASGSATWVTAATAVTSAALLPVDALAAALEQTVAETGLFYESHLEQWLAGRYPGDALLNEPQARLAGQTAPFSADSGSAGGAAQSGASTALFGGSWDESVFDSPAGALFGGSATSRADGAQLPAPSPFGAASAEGRANATAMSGGNAAFYGGGRDALSQIAGAAGDGMRAGTAVPSHQSGTWSGAPASVAAAIHPETIPLVRQQLDLLATQQFRWTGEVWPGAKLDWTIEPEPDRHRGSGAQEAPGEQQAWRTRLTLALPTLGTVDADLVLKGTQLMVRVQANPAGAARLSQGGAAFGRRLQAAGIELAGLSIREVGGIDPATTAGTVHAATSAYARAAAAAADVDVNEAKSTATAEGTLGSGAGLAAAEERRPSSSPLDRLFDDPFDWGGA